MELNDILEKLSLPQDLTRRGFLKAASAAAALGLLNDARAKNGVRPYVILETAKGLIIADPNLCVACHRCELACTEFNDGKATPRLARIKITRNVMLRPLGHQPHSAHFRRARQRPGCSRHLPSVPAPGSLRQCLPARRYSG